MTEAVDEHFRLARDVRAIDRLQAVLALLEESGTAFVVEGGWAVSGHGSPIESVDVDVLMRSADYVRLERAARQKGLQMDSHATVARLGIDVRYRDEFNSLFARPELGYLPDDLLHARTQDVGIKLETNSLGFVAPAPPALFVMKLKAFHDRRRQWQASLDRRQLVWLDQEDADVVRSMDPSYWERKAGKDLFDLGFLSAKFDDAAAGIRLVGGRTAEAMVEALAGVPRPLADFAVDMTGRAGVDAVHPEELRASVQR